MKIQRALGLLIASGGIWSSSVSAQVVSVGFGMPQSVPLSPWLTAIMAALLAVASIAFLRKRIGSAAFMLMLSLTVGAISLQMQDSYASPPMPPPDLNLVSSPQTFDYTPYNYSACNTKQIPVKSATPTVIHSIDVTPSENWILDTVNSTCHVGSAVNGSCIVFVNERFLKGAVRSKC